MFKPVGVQRTDTTRALSDRVWHKCPYARWAHNFGGMIVGDDFANYGVLEAAPYQLIEGDANAAITIPTDEVGGVVRLSSSNNDNQECYLASGADEGGIVKIVKDSGKPVWFEFRCKVNEIVTGSVFIGLANEGFVAANAMADDQQLSAILDTSAPDFLGFITVGDDTPAGLDAIYMDQATTGAHKVHEDDAHTWVADEYMKGAIVFNGGNIIRYFINGAQVGGDLLADADEVPDGEELLFVAGCKADDTVDHQLDIDWWKLGYDVDGEVGTMQW